MANNTLDSGNCVHCGMALPPGAGFCPTCGASRATGMAPIVPHRVVVTGVGVISSLGTSAPESWSNLLAGKSGIKAIDALPADFSCRLRGDIDRAAVPSRFLDAKTARNTSTFSIWVTEAAGEALLDAGLLDEDFAPVTDISAGGAVIGNCVGGVYEDLIPAHDILNSRGPGRIQPHLHVKFPHNLAAYTAQWRFGMGGPSNTVVTACATGTQAIGEAYHAVRYGQAPVMLAGAGEVTSSDPLGVAGFMAMKALATDSNDSPEKAARPFDATRAGFVLGEGAAVLILEDYDFALARGAKVYAEIVGFASSNDAYHPIAPQPGGEGAARSMRAALAENSTDPAEVGHIQAHAASTPAGDLAEANAIRLVYGERAEEIPVTSIKGAIGHCMGAAGAIETAMGIFSIADQLLPPTLNYDHPDPAINLDIVHGEPRHHRFSVMAKHGFGLGGQNACLIIASAPAPFEQRRSAIYDG